MNKDYFMKQLERIAREANDQAFGEYNKITPEGVPFKMFYRGRLMSDLNTEKEIDGLVDAIISNIKTLGTKVEDAKFLAECKQQAQVTREKNKSFIHKIFDFLP